MATPRCPTRLKALHDGLTALFALHRPHEAAVEETYVNRNGAATLKLGYARGVALLAPALAGIPVLEYGAMIGQAGPWWAHGGASKEQVEMMVAPPAARRDAETRRRRRRARRRDLPRPPPRHPLGSRAGG